MVDRFTAMSWLEGLAQDDWRECHSDSEVQEIARQTLDMLKEQEAVKPILSVKDRCYYCGNCDETEVKTYDHYCPRCGRAVKWE